MEWFIKEISMAIIPGMFVIVGFIRFNAWVNAKIDKYNDKRNILTNHET